MESNLLLKFTSYINSQVLVFNFQKDAQAGLCYSQTPEDRFSRIEAHLVLFQQFFTADITQQKPSIFHEYFFRNETSPVHHSLCDSYQFFGKLNKKIYELQHEISSNGVCATSKGSDQPAHTHSLIRALASRLNIL